LHKQEFDELYKSVPSLKPEKLLDVFGPVRVHPFLEITVRRLFSEEKGRKPSMKKAVAKVNLLKIIEVGRHQRCQPQLLFAPRECVSELHRSTKGRRPGRYDLGSRVVVRGYFEDFRRICQAVDLIQDKGATLNVVEEGLRILHRAPYLGQLAIKIVDVGKALAEHGLAHAAHP
jgi:hypothetical protein